MWQIEVPYLSNGICLSKKSDLSFAWKTVNFMTAHWVILNFKRCLKISKIISDSWNMSTFCLMRKKVAKKSQKRCEKKDAKKGSSDSQVAVSKHILPYFFHLSKLKITQPTMDFVTRRSIEHPCFNLDFFFHFYCLNIG